MRRKLLLGIAGGGVATPTNWNPADKSATVTLTNSNLTAACSSGTNLGVRINRGFANTKKVFWEINIGAGTWGSDTGYGLANIGAALGTLASSALGGVICYSTNMWLNGSSAHVGGCPGNAQTNITIMIAVDLVNKLWWAQASNNVNQWNVQTGSGGTNNPATGVGGWSFAGLDTTLYPAAVFQASTDFPMTLNAAGPFVLTPPSGFTALAFA